MTELEYFERVRKLAEVKTKLLSDRKKRINDFKLVEEHYRAAKENFDRGLEENYRKLLEVDIAAADLVFDITKENEKRYNDGCINYESTEEESDIGAGETGASEGA